MFSFCLFQTEQDHQANRTELQNSKDDADEMILICAIQTRITKSSNVWLLTQDAQLGARAFRSGIPVVSFQQLQQAMRLGNGQSGVKGSSFLDGNVFGRYRLDDEKVGHFLGGPNMELLKVDKSVNEDDEIVSAHETRCCIIM